MMYWYSIVSIASLAENFASSSTANNIRVWALVYDRLAGRLLIVCLGTAEIGLFDVPPEKQRLRENEM